MFFRSRVAKEIFKLRSSDARERNAAVDALREISKSGVSDREATQALKAAAATYPPLQYDWQDASAELIRVAAQRPTDAALAIISVDWQAYSAAAKREALALIARNPSRSAAQVYAGLAEQYVREKNFEPLPTRGLLDHPRHADVLFPRLLHLAAVETVRWDVVELALKYFSDGQLAAGQLNEHVAPLLQFTRDLVTRAREHQCRGLWDEDYQETRHGAGLLLDLLGFFPIAAVREVLREVLALDDPRLLLFAAVSLVRQREAVPAAVFTKIAAAAETRNWLHKLLSELDALHLFPQQFAAQAAFAESEMVYWLTYPTELAQAPDEIELMRVVETGFGSDSAEIYLFRFKTLEPHWAASKGWMAGVAGPFRKEDSPSPTSYGAAFSKFAEWDSKTPDEHVKEIVDLLKEWSSS